ncbi:MAG: YbhB/YbcL family Raf kinase inhibitor-like protein [Patescibacteria group bacterium]|jgi:hypothetical protein
MKKILLFVCLINLAFFYAPKADSITVLKKVSNVHVLVKDNTSVTLAWNKVTNAENYKIKVLNRNKGLIKIVSTKNLRKKINNLTRNKVYYFKVRAKKGEITGPWSDLKKVRTANTDDEIEEEEITETTPTLDFSANAYSGNESAVSIDVAINISAASSNNITVSYATSDNTAISGSDYTSATGTLTIPSGATSATLSLSLVQDIDNENNETFYITLSNPSGATLASINNPATITVVDDDSLTISSPAFADNGSIPVEFTCDGSDVNPELNWISAPAGTQSFVIIVRDIDASNFMHWGVKNISSSASSVSQNSVPSGGTELPNDFSLTQYSGPCPPGGENHRYQWEIYALNTATVTASTISELETNMQGNIIEQDYITGTYGS